jgi:hypothetical protein
MAAHKPPTQDEESMDRTAVPADQAFERWQRTAVAAFFRAEARGFAPGHELEDWLAAEREVSTAASQDVRPFADRSPAVVPDIDPPPAKQRRRSRKSSAPGAPAQSSPAPDPAASKKAAPKKGSTRTRKSKPGVESELGGAA